MTKEDIKRINSQYLDDAESTFEMEEVFALAVKAIEQEPVLDKIKAEMEQIKEAEYQIYGKGSWRFVNKCLEILDKYKAESGLQER